jgi:hypothetical protein
MTNKMILMTKIRQVFRLYTQGESKRNISILTGVSRNTLKKYIIQYIRSGLTLDAIHLMSDHELELLFVNTVEPPKDERFDELQSLLPGYAKMISRKGMTITLIWKKLLT